MPDKFYYSDGTTSEIYDGTRRLNNADGPAVEWTSGSRWWYRNNQLHRIDGPAVERVDGSRAWYLFGHKLTEEEYKAAQADMATKDELYAKMRYG